MNEKDILRKDLEKKTRAVFDIHHREQAQDKELYERLKSLISTEYFGVQKDFFKGKIILDLGCGSNASASYRFLELGAEKVVSADLGEEWMVCAKEKLKKFGNRSVLKSENVSELSFDANSFDFVHCAGVLHHTEDPKKGFMELARVTKKGGRIYISIMANVKGVIYMCINHLRDKYKDDEEFKASIDKMNIDDMKKNVEWILTEKEKHEDSSEEEKAFFRGLFNNDFILTIKDRLQAPTYHNFDFTEEQIRDWYAEAELTDIKRLTRYTIGFKNLRKFLAPMYYHYDHPLSRYLLGEGYIQMIGIKK